MAGMGRAAADASLAMPDFPGLHELGTDSIPGGGFRPLGPSGVPSQRIKDNSMVDCSGVAGRRYVVLGAFAETR